MTPAPHVNDSAIDWLPALRAGDPDALARVYRAHAPALYAVAYRLTGRTQDAEDVVHDVFVGLPEALRRYDERGNFAGWLHRVTTRRALMHQRRIRDRREDGEEGMRVAVATGPSFGEQTDLERALTTLTPHLRHAFVLRVVEGYSHREIAALLGISVAASEVRLHRAIRRLRDLLGGTEA
jgi:RNA polymerase sigma-70 factor (ECF subfamily)